MQKIPRTPAQAQQIIRRNWESFKLRTAIAAPIAGTSAVRLFHTQQDIASGRVSCNAVDCRTPKTRQLPIAYTHCDVFTDKQRSGNSLTVFFVPPHNRSLSEADMMLEMTREMRHFESIFVTPLSDITDHRVNYLTSPLEYIDELSYTSDFEDAIGKVGSTITLELSKVNNDHGAIINISPGQIIHININGKLKFFQCRSNNGIFGEFTLLGQQGNHSMLSAEQIRLKLKSGLGHTIFYGYIPEITVSARIFACSSELDFAGHPLLGAASSIHEKCLPTFKDVSVKFKLNGERFVNVMVNAIGSRYHATMSQGRPIFLEQITSIPQITPFLEALNLNVNEYDTRFPAEVISTGLKYLIIPVISGIESAKITVDNLGEMLSSINADFVYVVDINHMIARTWENDGSSEDAATGSAAGPFGAYLVKHRIANVVDVVTINQGRFIHRPSKITVQVMDDFKDILVGGDVCMMGNGKVKITL